MRIGSPMTAMTARLPWAMRVLMSLAAAGCITPDSVHVAMVRTGQRAVDDAADAASQAGQSQVVDASAKSDATARNAASGAGGNAGTKGDAAPAPAVAPVIAGEVYDEKFDFVPGERVIVFDDFADTAVGDFPARWSLNGGGNAPMSVVHREGRKWFAADASNASTMSSSAHLRFGENVVLPPKYTVELDVAWPGAYKISLNYYCIITIDPAQMTSPHTQTALRPRAGTVQHVSILANGNYVKAYLGGERTVNDPDCAGDSRSGIDFEFGDFRTEGVGRTAKYLMTNFRLAEGGKDFLTSLTTEGHAVTHGITFDTGSDVIRPESGPVLRRILASLQNDPALRVEIVGHTDNEGGDKINLPLSERRAKAVKDWLVRQGVAGTRLTTRGRGATNPIDRNDSAEGRANNRRVELVKH